MSEYVRDTRIVYSESAKRYTDLVGTTVSSRFEAEQDRTVLRTFAEIAGPGAPVLDAGCGVGRVTRFLADSGLEPTGLDIASGMIDQAQTAHPDLRFATADLAHLPIADKTVKGVAYWYSIITTPPDHLNHIWDELRRVLTSTGVALIAFQSGAGEPCTRSKAYGTQTDLTLFRHRSEQVRDGLASRSLRIRSITTRQPIFDHEDSDQTFIIAER